jgi:NADP-dependent 3-hydroxy acid dehydrogenase YdfG
MPSRLKEKWVLITGASSGFGAAAATAFGAEGSRLLLGARRLERLEEVASQARTAGAPNVHVQSLDVTRPESVQAFVHWVQQHTDRVDVLVNNAGGAHGLEPVAEGNENDWATMLEVNVMGVLRMTKAVLPLMKSRPGGYILNIGSIAGRVAYEGGAAYCASKAGELQITRTLRLELSGTGIRVGTLDPGMAETEFSLVRFKGDEARAKKVYEGVTPLSSADVAEAMVWMASRPDHVCIDEMIIKATDQAAIHKVHRRPIAQKP